MTNPICCMCGKECEDEYGNNPAPLVTIDSARCCNACNRKVVEYRWVHTFDCEKVMNDKHEVE